MHERCTVTRSSSPHFGRRRSLGGGAALAAALDDGRRGGHAGERLAPQAGGSPELPGDPPPADATARESGAEAIAARLRPALAGGAPSRRRGSPPMAAHGRQLEPPG
jgi:hypothetical protein